MQTFVDYLRRILLSFLTLLVAVFRKDVPQIHEEDWDIEDGWHDDDDGGWMVM